MLTWGDGGFYILGFDSECFSESSCILREYSHIPIEYYSLCPTILLCPLHINQYLAFCLSFADMTFINWNIKDI